MKRALLLIVVPALLVALGFAQAPAASINTNQTNINGCLGGSDSSYTVVEDNTGHIFKITTSSVDLKPHLGHDVTLTGQRASKEGPAAADNSFAVTELNMISEHCAAAAAAPTATVTTPAETVVTPPADASAPVATVSTPSETASTPAARHPRRSETAATATTAPDVTASSSSETASAPAAATTPAAAASTPSETASTPPAAATPPVAPARHGALGLLIAVAVLVIVIGTLVPFLSRWRKQKMLERTDAPNLSFNRETSSDQDKPEQPRKAA